MEPLRWTRPDFIAHGMAHLAVREMQASDLEKIAANPRDIERAFGSLEKFIAKVSSRPTRALTLTDNGAPVACGGVTDSDTFTFAWLVACKELKPYRRVVLRE